ncbi:Dehydroquinase, class II [Moelleriella libera RCEF 2490]|uniref:Catabolic 3-dehydroquinase n=1 Tax=Moelleriella libera RCEF 2490 TaxID=1081109 RepID=A0A166P417_9HYPO|nr:Dehydroquinase, class II [Moelleriella libera RCEF 2490]
MASLRTLAAAKLACTLSTFQSNHEGALVERIHDVPAQGVDMVVINAGAYTHTSVAIRDALLGVGVPFVEVHVSNVHAREDFRRRSYLSDAAVGVVCGLGTYGYEAAIEFVVRHIAAIPLASSSPSSSSPSSTVERSSA